MTNRPKRVEELVGGQTDAAIGTRLVDLSKAVARRVLPEAIVDEVKQYRLYEKSEQPLYLKTRILNGVGLANLRSIRPPATVRSFVFVCFGNIMRSPMCEALMKRAAAALPKEQISVTSAGLNAIPGTPAHGWAIESARMFDVSLERHRARILTPEMVDQADAIFVMDYQNYVQILSQWQRARKKVFMMSAYAGADYRSVEIHDPYYLGQQGTASCYQILDMCIRNLADSLRTGYQSTNPASRANPKTRLQLDPGHGGTPCE